MGRFLVDPKLHNSWEAAIARVGMICCPSPSVLLLATIHPSLTRNVNRNFIIEVMVLHRPPRSPKLIRQIDLRTISQHCQAIQTDSAGCADCDAELGDLEGGGLAHAETLTAIRRQRLLASLSRQLHGVKAI